MVKTQRFSATAQFTFVPRTKDQAYSSNGNAHRSAPTWDLALELTLAKSNYKRKSRRGLTLRVFGGYGVMFKCAELSVCDVITGSHVIQRRHTLHALLTNNAVRYRTCRTLQRQDTQPASRRNNIFVFVTHPLKTNKGDVSASRPCGHECSSGVVM